MATSDELSRFIWRDDLVQELIDLYRERPCLYDNKSKDYQNIHMKKECFEEMAEQLGSTGEEVMRKLKCIRSQYSREKQKARIRKSRSGGSDVYISRWIHYNRLSFLDRFLIAKNSPNAMNGDNLQVLDDAEAFMVDGANNIAMLPPEPIPMPLLQQPEVHVNKRRRSDSEEELSIKVMASVDRAVKEKLKRSSTHEIFGQYVASELDDIESLELQRWAKQQITAVLYQAQSGQLLTSPARIPTSNLL